MAASLLAWFVTVGGFFFPTRLRDFLCESMSHAHFYKCREGHAPFQYPVFFGKWCSESMMTFQMQRRRSSFSSGRRRASLSQFWTHAQFSEHWRCGSAMSAFAKIFSLYSITWISEKRLLFDTMEYFPLRGSNKKSAFFLIFLTIKLAHGPKRSSYSPDFTLPLF